MLQQLREKERQDCTFYFVSADQLRESTEHTLPPFQELRKRGGFLRQQLITQVGSFNAEYKQVFLAVSHRWLGTRHDAGDARRPGTPSPRHA